MKNICIDIDGTVTSPYNYIPYLNSIYNKDLKENDVTTVYWAELYGDTLEGMLEKLNSRYPNSYSDAKLVEGVKSAIDELYKENNLYFVTARHSNLEQITLDWLEENELAHVPLYLLGTDKKLNKARELSCDIFIEDHPKNALHLADGGIKVILIDCNYNKGIEHENITRVYSWQEISKVINEL